MRKVLAVLTVCIVASCQQAAAQGGVCMSRSGAPMPRIDRAGCGPQYQWVADAALKADEVRVCVSAGGTRFERLTSTECAAQGWEMTVFRRLDLADLPSPDEVASARKRCEDGEMRAVCVEDVRRAAAHNPPQPVDPKPQPVVDPESVRQDALMRQRCEADWPDDFRMQRFCLDQQQEGRRSIRRWLSENEAKASQQLKTAVLRCHVEWLDAHGYDWKMVNFCVDQQHKAYRILR